jgi:hypothetical protein
MQLRMQSQVPVIMRRNHRSTVFISGTLIGHQRHTHRPSGAVEPIGGRMQ